MDTQQINTVTTKKTDTRGIEKFIENSQVHERGVNMKDVGKTISDQLGSEKPQTQALAVPETTKTKLDVVSDDSGVFRPRNLDEAFRLSVALHKSKLLPSRFDSPESILAGMQFALELNLKPITAMRQIAVINGVPSLFGDLPLSLCQSSGKLEWIKEYYLDKEQKEICEKNGNLKETTWGAVCVLKRRGDPEVATGIFTMDDAKTAGLGNSNTWKQYPKRMLRYRARSAAIKDKFADAINGVAIAEYDFNLIPVEDSPRVVMETQGKAAELSEKVHGQK